MFLDWTEFLGENIPEFYRNETPFDTHRSKTDLILDLNILKACQRALLFALDFKMESNESLNQILDYYCPAKKEILEHYEALYLEEKEKNG